MMIAKQMFFMFIMPIITFVVLAFNGLYPKEETFKFFAIFLPLCLLYALLAEVTVTKKDKEKFSKSIEKLVDKEMGINQDIKTVNVIRFSDDKCTSVISLTSWPDNKDNNKLAEKEFVKILHEVNAGSEYLTDEDINVHLDDGYYEGENGEVVILTHSC